MSRTRRFGEPKPGEPRHRRAPSDASFRCASCRRLISASAPGTRHRNHCPSCLWSVHVDRRAGDRAAGCGARMEPIAIWVRSDGEWALVHRCLGCRVVKTNRIAGDDNEFVLMALATRAIAQPAFPLESLTRTRSDSDESEP